MMTDADVRAKLSETLRPFANHVKTDLEPFVNRALSRTFEPTGQMPLVVYSLARKCLKAFSSAVILGSRGYGEDAMLVTRSMIDATVTAATLEENPAKADDFLTFYWIYEYRLLQDLRGLDQKYAESIFTRDRAMEAEQRFNEVRDRYGISTDKYWRGTWHGSSMLKLIGCLKRSEYGVLRELYVLAYRKGSDAAHGTVIDLIERVERGDRGMEIGAGPSENLVLAALASAHASLLLMLTVCNYALELGLESSLNDLNKKHSQLWPG